MSNNNNSPNNGTIYATFLEIISHSRFKAPLVTLLVLASGTFAIWQSLPEQTHALTWLPIIEPGTSGVVTRGEAHLKILKRQAVFLDRLVEAFLELAR